MKKKMKLRRKYNLTGWIFILPAALLICWMSFYPMIQAFILSLKTGTGLNPVFGGFHNYFRIWKIKLFGSAFLIQVFI